MQKITLAIFIICTLAACFSNELEKQKGISLSQTADNDSNNDLKNNDTFQALVTRPSGDVLLTAHADHRLITVYKLNYDKNGKNSFIGSNDYHRSYRDESQDSTNVWHHHIIPGLEALYGYNLLSVAHYNVKTKKRKQLFEDLGLVNTLYYPSFRTDTLNGKAIQRDYYMVSIYDEDTNRDSLINHKDLRRFYRFDMNGENKQHLIPMNYSVLSSDYDLVNDIMYVYARLDENGNGKQEEEEAVHIFGLDLKAPKLGDRVY